MAEKKGVGHAYNVDFLNVVFAASSLFLFLSVVWMVWDDYDRDWKNTQRRFAQLEYQVTQAQLAAGGARASTRTSCSSSRRSRRRRSRTSRRTRQKVDELQDKLKDADNRLYRATARLPDDEGDLRPGSLRLRGVARQRRCRARRRKAQIADDEAKQLNELNLAMREGGRRQGRRPEAARPVHRRRSRPMQKQIDEHERRADAPAASALDVDRAERAEGLLPQRAAARLHGADDQGPADHPAERRRRRELHPRAEDGSVPDLPSGDRQEGLREVSAAVHDASRISRPISAAARRTRSTRPAAPCATRAWGSRSASATRRTRRATRSRRRSGRRSTTGSSRTCGTTRCCRRR